MLEVEGERLFVPAAAAQYILTASGRELETLETLETWLHWESSSLYPAVLGLLAKPADQTLLAQIKHLLVRADTLLGSQQFIGSSLGLADILVWCDIYPIFTDNKAKKSLASLTNVCRWFDLVAKDPRVVASLAKFGTGIDGCKNAAPTMFSPTLLSSTNEPAQAPSNPPPRRPTLRSPGFLWIPPWWPRPKLPGVRSLARPSVELGRFCLRKERETS